MGLFEGENKKADIFDLMEKFEKSAIAELELEITDTIKIKLSKSAAVPVYIPEVKPASPSAVTDDPVVITANENFKVIKAPIIGTFYSSSSPEAAPYVKIGDQINKGAIICILEAMKVMNEIECEQDCEIVEILVNNGDQIEYGQPLFKIK